MTSYVGGARTARDSAKRLLRRIIAPFAAFSEFLPIESTRDNGWSGRLGGERLTHWAYSESCSVGVKIPHHEFVVQEYLVVSRNEFFF